MHYIKDIFEKKETQHSHNKFIRYSKGKFVGPLMKIKFSKTDIKIATSFHFTDELLKLMVEIIGDKVIPIKGFLIWNTDLSKELSSIGIKYSKVSKSRGIFKYTIENEVSLKDFMEKMGNFNLLISVKNENISLTTKTSFPKPNKEFGANFCKVTFPVEFKDIIFKEFLFDVKSNSAKSVEIKHEINVEDIELPNIDDFDKARRLAKRVGTIHRFVSLDGSEFKETKINFKV